MKTTKSLTMRALSNLIIAKQQERFDQSPMGLAQIIHDRRMEVAFFADAAGQYAYHCQVKSDSEFWESARRSAWEDYANALNELRRYEALSIKRYGRIVGIRYDGVVKSRRDIAGRRVCVL